MVKYVVKYFSSKHKCSSMCNKAPVTKRRMKRQTSVTGMRAHTSGTTVKTVARSVRSEVLDVLKTTSIVCLSFVVYLALQMVGMVYKLITREVRRPSTDNDVSPRASPKSTDVQ